mgnify:CR=1 FL=1
MDSIIKQSVKRQRDVLEKILGDVLDLQAKELVPLMSSSIALNEHLERAIKELPYFKYKNVLDKDGIQLSATVKHVGSKFADVGRDRSRRPYMEHMFSPRDGSDFELSSAYIIKNKQRPSVTGVQLIRDENGELLGFLGVDYDLR